MKEGKARWTRQSVIRGLLKAGVVLVLCVALWFATWVLDRASLRLAWFTYGWTYGSFVNAIPVVLVFLLLLALFNRAALACVVTLALTVALYAANFLKLKYLDIPVSFSDVYLLSNLHVSTLKLLVHFTSLGRIAAALLIVVAIVAILLWSERRYFRRRSGPRLAVALVAVLCLVGAGSGVGWAGDVYGASSLRVVPFSPLLTQVHAGLLSSILYTDAERRQAARTPIDTAAADTFFAMHVNPQGLHRATVSVRPDIIVIQSESFFDPAILKGVANTTNTLPNLHRALAAGLGGTMKPPTFGGGTLRTEFEVLTGIPMAAYPQVEFPYLQIVQPVIPSFVRVLRKDGYQAVAIHANSPTFWNRAVAFKEIGFQKFISKPDFPPHAERDGTYISDKAMTNEIIATLKHAKSPALIFAISIEAHGPYQKSHVRHPERRDAIPVPDDLHGKAVADYQNYVYHIQNADRQMGRLWDFLRQRKRPFVLVFYGDHLAPLPKVYEQAGFDNGLTGPEQFVPWLIVGTGVQPRTSHIHSWMLGSDILREAGVSLPAYYRLVAKAQAGLADRPDDSRTAAIEQGLYALAQMHLRGTLTRFLDQSSVGDSRHAASTSRR